MEIGTATNVSNLSIARTQPREEGQAPNAFGIGAANTPEVELSPQARILQQNEQANNERRDALNPSRSPSDEQDQQSSSEISGNEFVRVSSSVGASAGRNNLTTERATEVYQEIQNLL